MTDILLDTNYFVALLDTSDKWNKTSLEIFTALQKYNANILVTDVVLNETINVICKRMENKGRSNEITHFLKIIEKQYTTDAIVWISEDIKKYHHHIMKLISDNHGLLNYNDCFLLAFMQKNKIKNIISFDTDFGRIKGINRISNKEFELK
jgi:predicted nucleic acid-binding protein